MEKLSQVLPNTKIIIGNIKPSDIRQGKLGDCYFMATISALTERPDRIYSLFFTREVNKAKYYSVTYIKVNG